MQKVPWQRSWWVTLLIFVGVVLWLGILWPRRPTTPATVKASSSRPPATRLRSRESGLGARLWAIARQIQRAATVGQKWTLGLRYRVVRKIVGRPVRPLHGSRASRKAQAEAAVRAWHWRSLLAQVVLSFPVSVLVPIGVLRAAGWTFQELGLGRPNRLGWRITLVAYLIALPFVVVMAMNPAFGEFYRRMFRPFWYKLSLTAYILFPEHISFQGWALALLLPTRAFRPVETARCEPGSSWWRRALMWVGLAQPTGVRGLGGWPAWAGIDRGILLAIALSGTHFLLAHAGKPGIEVFFSFVGGMGLAYLAVRSRSLWPCFLLHAMTAVTALLIMQVRYGFVMH